MDKRIGYGLTFKEAIDMAIKRTGDDATHFTFSTTDHGVIWGELRDDGWRVYSSVDAK